MTDIETEGGWIGMNIGNQQFTMKNLKISKAEIGINQIWNWGWLYKGIHIDSCGVAFSMSGTNDTTKNLLTGSVVIIDSQITNSPVFVDMVSITCFPCFICPLT